MCWKCYSVFIKATVGAGVQCRLRDEVLEWKLGEWTSAEVTKVNGDGTYDVKLLNNDLEDETYVGRNYRVYVTDIRPNQSPPPPTKGKLTGGTDEKVAGDGELTDVAATNKRTRAKIDEFTVLMNEQGKLHNNSGAADLLKGVDTIKESLHEYNIQAGEVDRCQIALSNAENADDEDAKKYARADLIKQNKELARMEADLAKTCNCLSASCVILRRRRLASVRFPPFQKLFEYGCRTCDWDCELSA